MAPHLTPRVVLSVIVALGTVGGLVALDRYFDSFDDEPFDRATWAAADEKRRGSMARDAIRHLPTGLPAERVRELLGGPDYVATDNPPDKWGRRCKGYTRWSYGLGSGNGRGWYYVDSADLDIHFDRDGRVTVAEITGG